MVFRFWQNHLSQPQTISPQQFQQAEDDLALLVVKAINSARVGEFHPFTTVHVLIQHGKPIEVTFENTHKTKLVAA
jgi:hypothetical protein